MNHRFSKSDGQWCKIEIMGHVEHIARAMEVPMLDEYEQHSIHMLIDAIQKNIYKIIDGKKMTRSDIMSEVLRISPNVEMVYFDEAFDRMILDVIIPNEPGGVALYWIDPAYIPF